MKLRIKYTIKQRDYKSDHVYSHVVKDAELKPVRIIRYSCGTGAAANRYHYQADFKAPSDAAFDYDGLMRMAVIRKLNPQFKPSKLEFEDNIWNA